MDLEIYPARIDASLGKRTLKRILVCGVAIRLSWSWKTVLSVSLVVARVEVQPGSAVGQDMFG